MSVAKRGRTQGGGRCEGIATTSGACGPGVRPLLLATVSSQLLSPIPNVATGNVHGALGKMQCV